MPARRSEVLDRAGVILEIFNRHAKSREAQYLEYQRSLNGNPTFLPPNNPLRPSKPPLVGDKKMHPPSVAVKSEPTAPSPPPIRYPMEDLELPPCRDEKHRPTLKFMMVGESDDDGAEDLLPDDLERIYRTIIDVCSDVQERA